MEDDEDEFTKFLERSPRKPFEHVYQQEGLFSRRFSDNILADVSTIQQKLRGIEEENELAVTHSRKDDCFADKENCQLFLKMMHTYNKGHHSKFHVVAKGMAKVDFVILRDN